MNPVSQASIHMAQRLLALEEAGGKGPENVVLVCQKLSVVLQAFAGKEGFRSLLSRALTLAKAQDKALAAVIVGEDGSLTGLDRICGESGAAAQILVAQLLDLLIIFIGEPLTAQLVHSAWPDASPGALFPRSEDAL